ncbi:Ionotropic receptor 139 [Diabrotica virgifera virgifera]|nr:Ionotropic receptor 139 [Diabrotica virgifera virgifera]
MLLLLLVFSGICFSKAYISVTNNTSILESCINSILDYIKHDKNFIYVINTNIRIRNVPIVSFNRTTDIGIVSTVLPDIYVVSGNAVKVLKNMYKSKMLVNSKYFIFIVQNINQRIENTLERHFIYKALFVTFNYKKDYYEIFKKTFTSHQLVDVCPKQKQNELKIGRKLNMTFTEKKKFDYLNVFYDIDPPYVISTTEGVHIELLNIIAENIKVKLNFIKSKKRTIATEISSEFIKNHTYDLYGALLSIKFQLQDFAYDLMITITEDKLVFITPNILITNNWAIFYGEFTNSVWAYFIFLLLTLSVIISLVDYLVPEKKNTDILCFLLSVLFEGTVTIYSKKLSIKIIFINYIIFVLILTTIYKAQMFDIMRKDNAYNPIRSRMDIMKFNFKVCLPEKLIFDSFKLSKNPIEHYIGWNSKLIIDKNYWKCINMTAYENTITVRLLKSLEYIVPQFYLDENGLPLVTILEEDFHSYVYCVFAFRKGHPLLNIFNKKLAILKETGFVEYQYKIYKQQFKKSVAAAQEKHSFNFKALKLNALQSVFIVYITLVGISSLVFSLELLLDKF